MGPLADFSPWSLSWSTWAMIWAALFAAHVCQLSIRRLYLSPIAHIPGPRLAALTWLYEFYYDVVLGGQYIFKILDLHKEYGPVIRINPFEVHVLGNKAFYYDLYAGASRPRDKWGFYARQLGANDSIFSTVDHNLHKVRRAALSPFFSVASVKKLQGVVEERIDAVLRHIAEHARSSTEPLDVALVFAAFTNDTINEYSFGRSLNLVEKPDFGRATIESIERGTHMGGTAKHLPWLLPLITALPDAWTEKYVPGWDEFNRLRKSIRAQLTEIQRSLQAGEASHADAGHRTIFSELLASSALPPREKAVDRLAQEGQILNQGGTLTTSHTLSVAVFHLLDQPDCLRRLRDELLAAFPDPHAAGDMSLADLQQLPYLGAVAKEALRLGLGGTSARLSRMAPDETLRYVETTRKKKTAEGGGDGDGKVWLIPPGTPVGMSSYQILTDEAVYPDPLRFRPQRWLDGEGGGDGADAQELYTFVFQAGTRNCLGQNLARAELYLMLAKLFLRWGGGGHVGRKDGEGEGAKVEVDKRGDAVGCMRLFETTVRDTQMAADRFVPEPYAGSKGVRVLLESYDG